MGDPRRLKKKYESLKKAWDKGRIEEDRKLREEYGLKNVKELRIMDLQLKKIRREARRILSLGDKGKELGKPLLNKVVRLGLSKEGTTLEDLLSLTIRDILERRLQTRVLKKGLARSIKQSRKFISHGLIAIDGKKISAPSYIVPVNEENKINYYKKIEFVPIAKGEETEKASEKTGEIQ